MWARRNLAIAGVVAAMLLMGPGSMRVQGLKVRANRAGMEPVGLALDAHLAEGMADGIQAAARVDASGARLYLADPYIPMDY